MSAEPDGRSAEVRKRQQGRWIGEKTIPQRTFDLFWDLGKALLFAAVFWLLARATGLVQGHPEVTQVALGLLIAFAGTALWSLSTDWSDDRGRTGSDYWQNGRGSAIRKVVRIIGVTLFYASVYVAILIVINTVGAWGWLAIPGLFVLIAATVTVLEVVADRRSGRAGSAQVDHPVGGNESD
jgi:hypothetical protein